MNHLVSRNLPALCGLEMVRNPVTAHPKTPSRSARFFFRRHTAITGICYATLTAKAHVCAQPLSIDIDPESSVAALTINHQSLPLSPCLSGKAGTTVHPKVDHRLKEPSSEDPNRTAPGSVVKPFLSRNQACWVHPGFIAEEDQEDPGLQRAR